MWKEIRNKNLITGSVAANSASIPVSPPGWNKKKSQKLESDFEYNNANVMKAANVSPVTIPKLNPAKKVVK